ncbi:sensor domain-containing diguanylate cyclase [Hamadaea tsunoensis]|uniref:sensor domain-containing diguanylate cyclase n=1 Tax=Hamadaea tsunoensis TaxID=53368 RepID=UPI0004172DF9|nr:sensor domain-containing diguanylate cyclase [Hamadaea tsunoensis]
MADGPGSLQVQQLLELLAVMSSFTDEDAAARGAAERAAQALEAEVAAVVLDGQVVAAIGFPRDAVAEQDLLAVGRRERDWLDVPGLGKSPAVTASWAGSRPGQLIVARWGYDSFSVEERSLVRGMARVLDLTLTMLRTLRVEHEMRQRSERQAAENTRLLESLHEQQRLLRHLSLIQRAIERRDPVPDVLDGIVAAALDLLGGEIVALWTRDAADSERLRLRTSAGLRGPETVSMPAGEAGAAGEALRRGEVVTVSGYAVSGTCLRDITDGHLRISMAVPVHENGQVCGALVVGSTVPGRIYTAEEAQTLRVLAQNVSLALTDAHTVRKMHQAAHDALTGLASRGLFLERLNEHLAEGRPAALLFLDLDRFKEANDEHGHIVGDEILTVTAARVTTHLRSTDLAGRYGGDEFALLLGDVEDPAEAVAVADRIIAAVGEPIFVSGRTVTVNASIGIALSGAGRTDALELIRAADAAMYQAKSAGRGRSSIHQPI